MRDKKNKAITEAITSAFTVVFVLAGVIASPWVFWHWANNKANSDPMEGWIVPVSNSKSSSSYLLKDSALIHVEKIDGKEVMERGATILSPNTYRYEPTHYKATYEMGNGTTRTETLRYDPSLYAR